MSDTTRIDRVLTDAAEWLMAVPEAQPYHLSAAAILLTEAARVMKGQLALADAMTQAPNVRAGNWRPRPSGQPDTLDQLAGDIKQCGYCAQLGHTTDEHGRADVSRETPADERPLCLGNAAGYGACVLRPGHADLCLDANGYAFMDERQNASSVTGQ